MAPLSPEPPVGRRQKAQLDARLLLSVLDDGPHVEGELLGGEATTAVAHLQAPELRAHGSVGRTRQQQTGPKFIQLARPQRQPRPSTFSFVRGARGSIESLNRRALR